MSFRIPNEFKKDMSLDEAINVVVRSGNLLAGMEEINKAWDRHNADQDLFGSDYDFFFEYALEVNAYNKVFEAGHKLFFGK